MNIYFKLFLTILFGLHFQSGFTKSIKDINETIEIKDGFLNLSNQNLDSLEGLPSINNISLVKDLSLKYNNLSNLPDKIFDNLISLENLDLSYNQLNNLQANIFDNLTSLKYLYLDSNKLTNLPNTIFNNLKNLETLELGNNQLSLTPNIFDNLSNLKYLALWENKLESLPAGIFNNLKNLEALDLRDNQLSSEVIKNIKRSLKPLNILFEPQNIRPSQVSIKELINNLEQLKKELGTLHESLVKLK